jgi:hypothetical protein
MSYEVVDSIIDAWVLRHGFTLCREFGGRPARFIYLSRGNECCQISIEPPVLGEVLIHARDIETFEHEEMQMDWKIFTVELEHALENAVLAVKQWFDR